MTLLYGFSDSKGGNSKFTLQEKHAFQHGDHTKGLITLCIVSLAFWMLPRVFTPRVYERKSFYITLGKKASKLRFSSRFGKLYQNANPTQSVLSP